MTLQVSFLRDFNFPQAKVLVAQLGLKAESLIINSVERSPTGFYKKQALGHFADSH
jgi:hypothetical protein